MADLSEWITVPDVARGMKIEMTPRLNWSVGNRMQNTFRRRYGRQPPKVLAEKTSGGGSHCFAIYPPEWRKEIEAVIREYRSDAKKRDEEEE